MKTDSFFLFILYLYLISESFSRIHTTILLNYILTVIVFAVSIYYTFCYFNIKIKNLAPIGIIITLFCLINIYNWSISPKQVYSIAYGVYKNTSQILTATLINMGIFFTTFILFKRNVLTKNNLYYIVIIIFMMSIYSYFDTSSGLDYSSTHGIANNMGYPLITFFILSSIKGFSKINFVTFFITSLLIILSAKRGAIICLALMSFLFFYYRYSLLPVVKRILLFAFCTSLFSMTSIFIYFSNSNLQRKIESALEGDTSGRDTMYGILWDKWFQSNTYEKIFGLQYAGTYKIYGFDAHNDWLELLIGQGLLGCTVYLLFLVILGIYYMKLKKYFLPHEKFIYVSIYSMWIIRTFISQIFYNNEAKYFMLIISILLCTSIYRSRIKNTI